MLVLWVLFVQVDADVYLNNPRGSNNKLAENSNNVQNDQRLFDSENNGNAGYHVGDNCGQDNDRPVCHQNNNNNYRNSQIGSVEQGGGGGLQGIMTYYKGSELYVEWLSQHGCGVHSSDTQACQVILQYMCDGHADDLQGVRDGLDRDGGDGENTAGGDTNNGNGGNGAKEEEANNVERGRHESWEYFARGEARDRNNGLYTAWSEDQPGRRRRGGQRRRVSDDEGALATRQNPAGDRYGLEVAEERDHYPYWHPSEWIDIAVLTSEPTKRCAYYRNNTQNVVGKHWCEGGADKWVYNNQEDCEQEGGEWELHAPWGVDPPLCSGHPVQRDNHLGNLQAPDEEGVMQPMSYNWVIPDPPLDCEPDCRCVLRVRYNITSGDLVNLTGEVEETKQTFDYFDVDHTFNNKDVFGLTDDPSEDFVGLGDDKSGPLEANVNTDQFPRTFEDRTHLFYIRNRPDDVTASTRIVNYNVRGRRGNIVQVYPSVEYDFVPAHLKVEEGAFLHIQWTGSDAGQANQAGNGKDRTDRTNLVQLSSSTAMQPAPADQHRFLCDGSAGDAACDQLIAKFAYLNQDAYGDCQLEADDDDDDDDEDNCRQLNQSPGYFDGGLIEMKALGSHHFVSTRNNDFSNRRNMGSVRVVAALGEKPAKAVGLAVGGALLGLYVLLAAWAFTHPTGSLYTRSRWKAKRWLLAPCPRGALAHRDEIRRWHQLAVSRSIEGQALRDRSMSGAPDFATLAPAPRPLLSSGTVLLLGYCFANVLAAVTGYLRNLDGGFEGSVWFPVAKAGGYLLDLNLGIIVLPVMRNIMSMLRASPLASKIPLDDHVKLHEVAAMAVLVGTAVHCVGHAQHALAITGGEPIYSPWAISASQRVAGQSIWEQIAGATQYRFAHISGAVLLVLYALMFLTAMPCVRKRKGTYRLFQSVHKLWAPGYLICLVHAPHAWVWWLWPGLLLLLDRVISRPGQQRCAGLQEATCLSRGVLRVILNVPDAFTYTAGQYVMLRCDNLNDEWHPFTITSAPEENILELNIRATDDMDWCSELRNTLVPVPSYWSQGGPPVQYSQVTERNPGFAHATVRNVANLKGHKHADKAAISSLDLAKRVNSAELAFLPAAKENKYASPENMSVMLRLDGPFGAPAEQVWTYKTAMLVGAGIGVTPFASILRSWKCKLRAARATTDRSLRRPNVEKMHFYWICKTMEEFHWFEDLLIQAISGPGKDSFDFNLFATGSVDLKSVEKSKSAELLHGHQFFGRPNWGRIFGDVKKRYPAQHVGVFLCGPDPIRRDLVKAAKHFTDHVTQFSVHAESF